jgi:hypothetical protein
MEIRARGGLSRLKKINTSISAVDFVIDSNMMQVLEKSYLYNYFVTAHSLWGIKLMKNFMQFLKKVICIIT